MRRRWPLAQGERVTTPYEYQALHQTHSHAASATRTFRASDASTARCGRRSQLIALITSVFFCLSMLLWYFLTDDKVIITHVWEMDNSNFRDWNPKWSTIPSDELSSHFTEYELASLKAQQALVAAVPFNESLKAQILQQNECVSPHVSYGMSCCLGTVSGTRWGHRDDRCYKGEYDIRMEAFRQRKPSTTHDMFWSLPNNSNVIVIGDSVSDQIFIGFGCDVARQNHLRGRESEIKIDQQEMWQDVMKTNFGMKRKWTHKNRPTQITLSSILDDKIHVVNAIYLRDYTPHLDMYKETFCDWANVILVNWDLHYKHPDALWQKEVAAGFFPILQQCFVRHQSLQRKPIFIWNELTAQHFGGTVGGFYENIYADNRSLTNLYRAQITKEENDLELWTNDAKWDAFIDSEKRFERSAPCGPHRYFIDKDRERHVRRQRVFDAINGNPELSFELEIVYPDRPIQRLRDNTLYFIPFKDVTDPLWKLHKDGDCTHYCTTPFLWEMLWDSMSRIIAKNAERLM